jgi:hypothetical protein
VKASDAASGSRKTEDLVEGQKRILDLINSGHPLPEILDAIHISALELTIEPDVNRREAIATLSACSVA